MMSSYWYYIDSIYKVYQTFKVLPQDVSRTFTLCMLCEHSIHRLN